jgi:hypothetical protein
MDNLKVENNILLTHNYAVIQFGERLYLNTATIRNNVMLNVGGSSYLNYGEADFPFPALNGWDVLKGGNVLGDPLFKAVNAAWYGSPHNYDFTLRPGSPAIGLALAADMPLVDLVQAARGASRDAGAYYFSASGGPVQPALTIAALACTPITPSQPASTCTVTLSGMAPTGGTTVLLSGSGILLVPASITVPGGTALASFTGAPGTAIVRRSAIVTATLNGVSKSATVLMELGSGQATGGRKP